MDFVECSTQAEVDRVTAAGDVAIVRSGFYRASDSASVQAYDSASVQAYGSASVRAYGSASVLAYGSASVRASGSASVRASGSASVRAYGSASVLAYGSASVRASGSASVRAYGSASVRAYGSASVRASGSASVRAYGSASVRAYGSASVRAYGSASVQASKFVAVTRCGNTATVDGGVLIQIPAVDTIEEWADFYGLAVEDGEVVVFKAVDDVLKSGYAMEYPIGGEVSAPDWDGATSCGGGLHFCARPFIATRYFGDATRYLACAVKVTDAVVVASWGQRPSDKIKAASCRVLHEVDIDGHALESTQESGS